MSVVYEKPGHLIRRLQQAAVAIFHKEVGELGYDLTPVQYAALDKTQANPGIDQMTLAGLIAYDRATITGVIDRLVQKGLMVREVNKLDRRARLLKLTDKGLKVLQEVTPAVEAAQDIILQGLTKNEAKEFMLLLHKATLAVNELSRAPMRVPLKEAISA